jgi:DNA-binding LacI/PurR family transcriptional regulator
MSSFKHTGDIFNKLWAAHVPCVVFGPPPNGAGIKYDAISEETPSAIGHLIDYGHKDIVIATGFLAKDVLKTRIKGYQAEFKKYGLEFTLERNLKCSAATSGCQAKDGYLCGKEIFSKSLTTTAIVCINDYFACGVMRAALDAGLMVPDDISIIGNDNIWAGKYSPIPLTTIDQNLNQVAEKALKLICKRLKNKNWDEPEHCTVKSELIIRESTAKLQMTN